MRPMFIALSLFCILFSSCKKDKNNPEPDNPYGLPNATQTGANIFACRVNGQNWISEKGIYKMGGSVMSDTLSVKGGVGSDNIFLLIKGTFSEGTIYGINGNNKANYTTTKLCATNVIGFYSYEAMSGFLKLSKVDLDQKILSGTFSFTVIRPACNDTLNFTDGRFDIRY